MRPSIPWEHAKASPARLGNRQCRCAHVGAFRTTRPRAASSIPGAADPMPYERPPRHPHRHGQQVDRATPQPPQQPPIHAAPEHIRSIRPRGASPSSGARTHALVGLKATGIDLYFPDEQILHYDSAGRLLRIAEPYCQWRRGLSGRMLEVRRRPADGGGGLERRLVDRRRSHTTNRGRCGPSGQVLR